MSQAATDTDDLKHVLDVARAALDREFQRAERFDAKARGQATLAGSWFAVTQAVSAVSIRPDTPKWWLVGVLAALLLQAVALVLLLAASAAVWKLQERDDVGPETLEAMRESAGDADFADRAISLYSDILGGAQVANKLRADAFEGASNLWWWAVLLLGFAEIAVSLLSRVIAG
jgi:hypothetical protein